MYRSPFTVQPRCTCTFQKPGNWSCGYHTGEDWVSDGDRTLVSPADGTLVRNRYDQSYGHYLVIRTSDNKSILLAHLAGKSSVAEGAKVHAGQPLGQMGNSGHSSGAHLHIEVQASPTWAYNRHLLRPSAYLDFAEVSGEVKKQLKIKLNGKLKTVTAIESEGYNYLKLQDLRDQRLMIGYDNAAKIPTIDVK